MNKIELLAPAGDIERLKIAFLYGADSCYIGGKKYSLRANAKNFGINEIKEACNFAHSLNKKVYVTVNMIFHEEDLEGIEDYLKELSDAKVDAVIIADLFLIPIIKEKYPNLDIIISTQNTATNKEIVKFFLNQGIKRVVLARELSSIEIKEIIKETNVSAEIFLHGAMCACFSGRCLLSNYFTNRDANRGGCSQVCRYVFDLNKKRDIPFSFSTKDLMLAPHIDKIIEMGVATLKIEGRMRSTYYVASVISSYRKLLDAYYNNTYSEELLNKELNILNKVANRESSDQYFDKVATMQDQYFTNREEVSNQDFIGLVLDYNKETKMVTIEQRNYFKTGDQVQIFGPNNREINFIIDKIYDEDSNEIDCANHPKQIVTTKIPGIVCKDDMMRKYY